MLNSKPAEQSAAEFWAAFEKETGEKVSARALGEYFPPEGGPSIWGLLILTDRAFRFRATPGDNLIFGIFKRDDVKSLKKEIDLALPLDADFRAEKPQRGFWERFFGSPAEPFSVSGTDGLEIHFSASDKGFIEALIKAADLHIHSR